MGVAKQCYIRNISKEDQTLIKKASKIVDKKTTPSILLTVLDEFFKQKSEIEIQQQQLTTQQSEIKALSKELNSLKGDIQTLLDLELNIINQKKKLLKQAQNG